MNKQDSYRGKSPFSIQLFIIIALLVEMGLMLSCSGKNKVVMGNQSFMQLQKEIAEVLDSSERQARVDSFIKGLNSANYPIFENDSTVVLLFQTEKESAYIIGDMAESSFLPMQKIENSNLFYFRAQYEPDHEN